jgi:Mg-chelatase subunit ChlD
MTNAAARRPGPGPAGASVFVLLTDGSTAEIRPAGPQDAGTVREMHAAMSPVRAVPARPAPGSG